MTRDWLDEQMDAADHDCDVRNAYLEDQDADSDDRSGVETVLEECTVAAHMAAWSKRRAS